MIHDVDETLRDLIERLVVGGSDVDVSFDAPTKDWSARQTRPTISSFLYDIREDLSRRDVAPRVVKDQATGRTIGREAPPRRFRLSYLLTAWTQRPEDEHRLLSQLLSAFLASDQVPTGKDLPEGEDEYLKGSLLDASVPVIVTLALPPPQDRSLSDIWSALGGELKPSLDLVVVAPIVPGRNFETGPPVREVPRINVDDFSAEPDNVEKEREKRHRAPHPVSEEPVDDPKRPNTQRIQAGTDEHPGRTFEIQRLSRP